MKVGDVVKLKDWSYCMFYDGDGDVYHPKVNPVRGRRWRVKADNIKGPIGSSGGQPSGTNDLMLCDVERPGDILFTQSRYCVLQDPEPARFTVPAGTKELVITFEQG